MKLVSVGVVLFGGFISLCVAGIFVDMPMWMYNPYFAMGIGISGIACLLIGAYRKPVKKFVPPVSPEPSYELYQKLVQENERTWRNFESGR